MDVDHEAAIEAQVKFKHIENIGELCLSCFGEIDYYNINYLQDQDLGLNLAPADQVK